MRRQSSPLSEDSVRTDRSQPPTNAPVRFLLVRPIEGDSSPSRGGERILFLRASSGASQEDSSAFFTNQLAIRTESYQFLPNLVAKVTAHGSRLGITVQIPHMFAFCDVAGFDT